MILYHGGTEAVMQSDCKKRRPDLDFGQGFYVMLLQDHLQEGRQETVRVSRS